MLQLQDNPLFLQNLLELPPWDFHIQLAQMKAKNNYDLKDSINNI